MVIPCRRSGGAVLVRTIMCIAVLVAARWTPESFTARIVIFRRMITPYTAAPATFNSLSCSVAVKWALWIACHGDKSLLRYGRSSCKLLAA
jgi:hypothetical protein